MVKTLKELEEIARTLQFKNREGEVVLAESLTKEDLESGRFYLCDYEKLRTIADEFPKALTDYESPSIDYFQLCFNRNLHEVAERSEGLLSRLELVGINKYSQRLAETVKEMPTFRKLGFIPFSENHDGRTLIEEDHFPELTIEQRVQLLHVGGLAGHYSDARMIRELEKIRLNSDIEVDPGSSSCFELYLNYGSSELRYSENTKKNLKRLVEYHKRMRQLTTEGNQQNEEYVTLKNQVLELGKKFVKEWMKLLKEKNYDEEQRKVRGRINTHETSVFLLDFMLQRGLLPANELYSDTDNVCLYSGSESEKSHIFFNRQAGCWMPGQSIDKNVEKLSDFEYTGKPCSYGDASVLMGDADGLLGRKGSVDPEHFIGVLYDGKIVDLKTPISRIVQEYYQKIDRSVADLFEKPFALMVQKGGSNAPTYENAITRLRALSAKKRIEAGSSHEELFERCFVGGFGLVTGELTDDYKREILSLAEKPESENLEFIGNALELAMSELGYHAKTLKGYLTEVGKRYQIPVYVASTSGIEQLTEG